MIKRGTRYPKELKKGIRELQLLMRGSKPIWVSAPAAHAAKKAWLDEHVKTEAATTTDAVAKWFDLEITLPGNFTGSAEDGWTDGTIQLGLIYTLDLVAREVVPWITTPSTSVVDLGDGRKRHFARCSVAVQWMKVLLDFTLESDRHGKEITSLTVLGTEIQLGGFPYAMPADASRLQDDLRAVGADSATTVTVTAAPLRVMAKNYQFGGGYILTATMSGTSVTGMSKFGTAIALPHYPYSMPSQRTELQSDLVAAGYSGVVVSLHADAWTIFIPNVSTSGYFRDYSIQFQPGDPFPVWDTFGNQMANNPGDVENGQPVNVRSPLGTPLREEMRAFAAVRITNAPTLP
jgi:hypothetical protein